MSIKPCIIKPQIFTGTFQLLLKLEGPGFVIRKKMAFGSTSPNGYNGEIIIPFIRLFRSSETQAVSGIYNNRIEFWIDFILNNLLLANWQQYLVSPDSEM